MCELPLIPGSLVAAIAAVAAAQHPVDAIDHGVRRALRERLEAAAAADFSGVVAVRVGAGPPALAALGSDGGRPRRGDAPADAGPLAALWNACAALRLAMAGRIDPGASIGDYLEHVPWPLDRIRVEDLLRHRSGLPDVALDDRAATARDAFLARVLTCRPAAPPGRLARRNPVDDALLAAIVETASGREHGDALRALVFDPAGMHHTRVRPDADWRVRGGGGVETTAGDVLAWHRAQEGDLLLDAERRALLWAEVPGSVVVERDEEGTPVAARLLHDDGRTRVGYGWALDPPAAVAVLGRGGFDLGVVERALSAARTELAEDARAAALDAFVGRYRLGRDEEFDVARAGGTLVLRSLGQEATARLRHGRPTMPEWPRFYQEAAARLEVLIRPILHLDAPSAARSFHADAPPGAAERALELIGKLTERHGAAAGGRLVGTTAESGTRTWYRVAFGATTVTLVVDWYGELLRGLAVGEEFPFAVDLSPAGDGEFEGQSLDGRARLVVRFKPRGRGLELFDLTTTGRRGLRAARVKR